AVPLVARPRGRRRRRRRHLHRGASEPAGGALRRREPVLPRSGRRLRPAADRSAQSRSSASRTLREPVDLYLDSVEFKEIEAAFDFGFVKGLTTTPTFMHRHGITDIDGAIVKLSAMVPELQ